MACVLQKYSLFFLSYFSKSSDKNLSGAIVDFSVSHVGLRPWSHFVGGFKVHLLYFLGAVFLTFTRISSLNSSSKYITVFSQDRNGASKLMTPICLDNATITNILVMCPLLD